MKILDKFSRGLTSAVAAVALTCSANASEDGLGLKIDPYTDVGSSSSSYSQPVPGDWQDGFKPGRPTKLHRGSGLLWDVGLKIEPAYQTEDFRIGLPIFYSFNIMSGAFGAPFFGGPHRTVSQTTTEWWGDTVYVVDIMAEKKGPAVGVSFKKGNLGLQYALQKYELYRRNFSGIDNPGAPNGSKVENSERLESGLSSRFDLSYTFTGEEDAPIFNFGLFYEQMGSETRTIGISIKTDFEGFRFRR